MLPQDVLLKIRRRLAPLRRRAFARAIANAARGAVTLAPFPDIIAPPPLEITGGAALTNPLLREILRDDELGSWAFDAATLTFLEFQFGRDRPRAAIEFGAGVSTLALACWMKNIWQDEVVRVFSIEQNEWQIEKTRARLRENGLEKQVALFHAPLKPQKFFDVETQSYDLSLISASLGAAQANWVIVDGPAGDDLTRFGTLSQLENAVSPGAVWFLDDAIRPEERAVLAAWSKLPFLKVEGTFAVGKGLARGRFVTLS